MVNKQYNVQNLTKNKSNKNNNQTHSITVISTIPNLNEPILNNNNNSSGRSDQSAVSTFERNITQQQYFHHTDTYDLVDGTDHTIDSSDIDPIASINSSVIGANNDTQSQKHLSINDIGRFQYILQMDREMGVSHPNETVYRLPPLLPNASSPSSNSNSLNSGHQISYWKASSQSPIATATLPSGVTHRERVRHFLSQIWRYALWPIALLVVCITVAAIVYFLLAQNEITDPNLSTYSSQNQPFQPNYDRNAINFSNNYNSINRRNRTQNDSNRTQSPVLTTFRGDTSDNDDENYFNSKLPSTPSPSNIDSSTTTARSISTRSPQKKILLSSAPTTTSPFGKVSTTVKNVKIYTNSGDRQKLPQSAPKHTTLLLPTDDDSEDENIVERTKLLFPSKETFENFGFTSGHQNNFGVPIEEDERVLRMLNEQMLNSQRKLNQSEEYFVPSITTDRNVYQTKVSPTLPNLKKNFATTERVRALNASVDDGICRSTTMPLCRGILPYDLTNVKMAKPLSPQDLEHFQYSIESKCSLRAHEFVCSILEPECRPERIGPLLPCKRICKSIQESCADIVASSEMLTATFDCDIYPSSNDENEYKDVTRGTKCHKNEFQCNDQTCIPSQWQCDNIRDCPNAEDEENCSFCEENEFKCADSDKCIPEKWHCDQYEDCPDASDERDCELADESQTRESTFGNARIFPFAKQPISNKGTSPPFVLLPIDDRSSEKPSGKTKLSPVPLNDPIDILDKVKRNRVKNTTRDDEIDSDEDEIQGDASGITVPLSKSLANFRDSKEIMVTSDSEAEYKFSSSNFVPVHAAYVAQCPPGELRCINGHCITISQLCDKITDCPDGADEKMCNNS